MKLTYRQFLKEPVDLSPLGLLPSADFQPYFCTPKGARVFARSGVDGIHFCFVRGFGETVFAVSPMNGRDGCVHPVAKTFRDFLRLLLALHDAAAIEQAWQWNAAQLEDFEQKHPSDEAQRAVLSRISEVFGLLPMREPWKYIHTVQTGFDYGKLRFSEEFYDVTENPGTDGEPWKVTFTGGFWGAKGPAGKEISLGASFSWGGAQWLVPAAYLCREGIVLDIFRRVPVEALFSFREKWSLSPENDGSDWDAGRRMHARAENPFEEGFGAELTVNGRTLRQKHGCALCWDPLYDACSDRESRRVREHYGLDELDGWVFWRCSFPWEGRKQTSVRALSVRLWEEPADIPGPDFSPQQAGSAMTFRLPGKPETYTITALALHSEPIPYAGQTLYTTELSYQITPGPPEGAVALRDLAEPVTLHHDGFSGCTIGVIGGADGPVVLAAGRDSVCSQVRREKERKVTWTLIFREKRKEDKNVMLIEEKETKA